MNPSHNLSLGTNLQASPDCYAPLANNGTVSCSAEACEWTGLVANQPGTHTIQLSSLYDAFGSIVVTVTASGTVQCLAPTLHVNEYQNAMDLIFGVDTNLAAPATCNYALPNFDDGLVTGPLTCTWQQANWFRLSSPVYGDFQPFAGVSLEVEDGLMSADSQLVTNSLSVAAALPASLYAVELNASAPQAPSASQDIVLQIAVVQQPPTALSWNFQWSGPASLNLTAAVADPASLSSASGTITLLAGTLADHQQYNFTVTATLQAHRLDYLRLSYNSTDTFSWTQPLSFTTRNSAPSGGSCSVSPTNGTIYTHFTATCTGWTDVHTPLSYSLYRVPASGSPVLLTTNASGILRSLPQVSGQVNLQVRVGDAVGAVALWSTTVDVRLPETSTDDEAVTEAETVVNGQLSDAAASGDLDGFASALDSASQLLERTVNSTDTAVREERVALRSSMFSALEQLQNSSSGTTNVTAESLQSEAELMLTLTAAPEDLDPSLQRRAAQLAAQQAEKALSSGAGVSASLATTVLSTFDNVFTAAAVSQPNSTANQTQTQAEQQQVSAQFTAAASSLGKGMLQSASTGDTVTVSTEKLFLVAQRQSAAALSASASNFSQASVSGCTGVRGRGRGRGRDPKLVLTCRGREWAFVFLLAWCRPQAGCQRWMPPSWCRPAIPSCGRAPHKTAQAPLCPVWCRWTSPTPPPERGSACRVSSHTQQSKLCAAPTGRLLTCRADLSEPIAITFVHAEALEYIPVCRFFQPSPSPGRWSTEGCSLGSSVWVEAKQHWETTCHCTHLTGRPSAAWRSVAWRGLACESSPSAHSLRPRVWIPQAAHQHHRRR